MATEIQTTFTAAQIGKLTAICTGKPAGRAASKDAALRRFAAALAERIGEDLAAVEGPVIIGASGPETAEGELIAAIEGADERERQRAEIEADAPRQDDPAPIGKAVAVFDAEPEEAEAPAPEAKTRGPRNSLAGARLYQIANARREGTRAWVSAQIIAENPGITYEDFIARGGVATDLRWDIKMGNARAEIA